MYPFPDPNDSPMWGSGMNVSSGMDCTGLIPSAIVNDSEEENYSELYDYLPDPPKNERNIRR